MTVLVDLDGVAHAIHRSYGGASTACSLSWSSDERGRDRRLVLYEEGEVSCLTCLSRPGEWACYVGFPWRSV